MLDGQYAVEYRANVAPAARARACVRVRTESSKEHSCFYPRARARGRVASQQHTGGREATWQLHTQYLLASRLLLLLLLLDNKGRMPFFSTFLLTFGAFKGRAGARAGGYA
jgi:hypothetical protein